MSETLTQAAAGACREYEHWASEVRRLTEEIGATECPRERRAREEVERREAVGDLSWFAMPADAGESHFKLASEAESIPDGFDYNPDGEGATYRRPNLSEIAAEPEVADCPACARLVELIRARRHARRRYGAAKRSVRHFGKRLLAEGGPS